MKYHTWEITYKVGFGKTEKRSSIDILSTDVECAVYSAKEQLAHAGLVAEIEKVERVIK